MIEDKKLGLKVIERLAAITGHTIGSHPVVKPYSKNKKTVLYYDCDTEQYMKCTVTIGISSISVSNIRSDKDFMGCNGNCKPTAMKLDQKCRLHGW